MSRSESVAAIVCVLIVACSAVAVAFNYTAARRYHVEQATIRASETRLIQEEKTRRTKERMRWIPWYKKSDNGN